MELERRSASSSGEPAPAPGAAAAGGASAGVAERPAGLAALARQLDLAVAAGLARAGQMSAAETLLAGAAGTAGDDPLALDLRARICSQQGRLREAEILWQQALALAPGTPAFTAGLNRIQRLQSRRADVDRSVRLLGSLLVAAAVVMAGVAMQRRLGETGRRQAHAGPLPLAASIAGSSSPQAKRAGAEAGEAPAGEESGAVLATVLRQTGLSWRREGRELVGTFAAGVFDHGTHLRQHAKQQLTAMGRGLATLAGRVELRVIGAADDLALPPGSRYPDNFALSLARAESVVRHLHATTRLASERIWVQGGADLLPPYANDSSAGRARNRTVVLRLCCVR